MMNNVIISGAGSMLGLALINQCLQQERKITAVIRPYSSNRYKIPKSKLLNIVECDLADYSDFTLDGSYDTFYHFAWTKTANRSRNDVNAQSKNIQYTLDALRLAKRLGCQRFIGAGSQAEYGRVSGKVTEDRSVSPDSAYGIAKYSSGRLGAILAKELGLEFIWARVFSTYGDNDMYSTMIMYCVTELLAGQEPELTKCEQLWDYLYCGDAGRAFYLIGENGSDQSIYNIGSGDAHSLYEYVEEIRNQIDPLLPLGIGKRPYAPKQVMHLEADISHISNDTGFKPSTSFHDGITKTIEWVRQDQKRNNNKNS